jgi:hypothetical protein
MELQCLDLGQVLMGGPTSDLRAAYERLLACVADGNKNVTVIREKQKACIAARP